MVFPSEEDVVDGRAGRVDMAGRWEELSPSTARGRYRRVS